jgi:hypothetical protein
MTQLVLNRSLASGLGRPDLAYSAQGGGAVQTAIPPLTSVVAGAGDGGYFDFAARGSLVALFALVAGYVAFAYWVRPHLA